MAPNQLADGGSLRASEALTKKSSGLVFKIVNIHRKNMIGIHVRELLYYKVVNKLCISYSFILGSKNYGVCVGGWVVDLLGV